MIKIVVSVTSPQLDWLKSEAARLNISTAELLRRIIDKERKA